MRAELYNFCINVLGSVYISSKPDNQGRYTDTCLFVGVGSPNPLFTHQTGTLTAVGRLFKIDNNSEYSVIFRLN